MKKLTLLIPLLFAFAGCATITPAPLEITLVPDQDLQYSEIVKGNMISTGDYVRWGGKIIAVDKGESSTRITALSTNIKENGRPDIKRNDKVGSRFIIDVPNENLNRNPRRNSHLTAYGQVVSSELLSVGKTEVLTPIIASNQTYVWRDYNARYVDNCLGYFVYNNRIRIYGHHGFSSLNLRWPC